MRLNQRRRQARRLFIENLEDRRVLALVAAVSYPVGSGPISEIAAVSRLRRSRISTDSRCRRGRAGFRRNCHRPDAVRDLKNLLNDIGI